MGADAIPLAVVTGFFAIIGGVLPFVAAKGPNRGVIQVVLVITAASCWLFWLLAYMHQMNPLIGPQLHNTTVLALQYIWDHNLNISELTTTTAATLSSAATTAATTLTSAATTLTSA